jgi:hypothetical protein
LLESIPGTPDESSNYHGCGCASRRRTTTSTHVLQCTRVHIRGVVGPEKVWQETKLLSKIHARADLVESNVWSLGMFGKANDLYLDMHAQLYIFSGVTCMWKSKKDNKKVWQKNQGLTRGRTLLGYVWPLGMFDFRIVEAPPHPSPQAFTANGQRKTKTLDLYTAMSCRKQVATTTGLSS